uniref:Peptidase S1 domain-containing protein n=1 Tax=Anopheles farauti TaxID=69004 RepID=A0A182QFM8_9DIPT
MELSVFVLGLATILAVSVVARQTSRSSGQCAANEICVASDKCVDGMIDTVGQNILGPRINTPCDDFGMTCCGYNPSTFAGGEDSDSEEHMTSKTTTTRTTTTTTEEPDDPDWSAQCGVRSVSSESVDNFNETARFEYPWSVAVFSVKKILNRPKNEFLCGGTLIDDYIVLTAARCVHQRFTGTLRVQLGRWDLDAAGEPRTQEIAVERVISHPGYMPSSHVHNIALLFLAGAVGLGRSANRVCLPDPSVNYYTHSQCYVHGWRNIPLKDTPNQQLKLHANFHDRQECTQLIKAATGTWQFRLPKENICPSYVAEPGCPRAPGSALVCEAPDSDQQQAQFFLVGIASYAVRDSCTASKAPEVFSNVSDYVSWIDRHVTELGRETSFYRPDPAEFDDD